MISEKTVIPLGFAVFLASGIWWAGGRDTALASLTHRVDRVEENQRVSQTLAVEMASVKTQMEEMNKRLDRMGDAIRSLRK